MSLPHIASSLATKRRQIALSLFGAAAFVSLVVFGLWFSDPRRGKSEEMQADAQADVVKNYATPSADIDPAEVWISRSEAELKAMRDRNEEMARQLEELRNQRPTHDEAPVPPPALPPPPGAALSRPPLPLPPILGRAPAVPPPPLPAAQATQVVPGPEGPVTAPGILSVSFTRYTKADSATGVNPEGEAGAQQRTIDNFLPVSFVKAVLMSGLDAPTGGLAKTNPHPVLFRLADNAWLPNHYRSAIRECFATGEGYGDLSSERAYIRLNLLSCVLTSREVMELKVKGYASGEDGKIGLRGRVVSKQGALIARALFAGLAGGFGQAIAQSYSQVSTNPLGAVTTVPTGDIARYGAAQGAGRALERIADYYIERANELYPIVEIASRREADLVFNEGIDLDPSFEKLHRTVALGDRR